jgi:hypothetical protein
MGNVRGARYGLIVTEENLNESSPGWKFTTYSPKDIQREPDYTV